MSQIELGNVPGELRFQQTIEVASEEQTKILPSDIATELRRSGRRIDYVAVKLSECTDEQRVELARLLGELAKPIFESVYGPETSDAKEDIGGLLAIPEATLLIALDRGEGAGESKALGYLVGFPALAYNIKPEDVTTDDNRQLKLPERDTFYLHALGVLPEARNRKVGFNLWNIFRQEIFPPFSRWKSVALFAALRPKDRQSYMLKLLERELSLPRLREEGRVSEGDITSYREGDEVKNRLVAVHYLFIDLRGKFETALIVPPDPPLVTDT